MHVDFVLIDMPRPGQPATSTWCWGGRSNAAHRASCCCHRMSSGGRQLKRQPLVERDWHGRALTRGRLGIWLGRSPSRQLFCCSGFKAKNATMLCGQALRCPSSFGVSWLANSRLATPALPEQSVRDMQKSRRVLGIAPCPVCPHVAKSQKPSAAKELLVAAGGSSSHGRSPANEDSGHGWLKRTGQRQKHDLSVCLRSWCALVTILQIQTRLSVLEDNFVPLLLFG